MRVAVVLVGLLGCRPATEVRRDEERPVVLAPDAAPCFRYVPRQYDQHAGACFPSAELACEADCEKVHLCQVIGEDHRDNVLAHPETFGGGLVVPMRGPGQTDGVLVTCVGW